MIPKLFLLAVIFSASNVLPAQAQEYLLTGKITNTRLEPLPYASVRVKELQTGTIAGADGSFSLQLEAGKYDLVVTMTGYKTQVLTLVLTGDYRQNIIMENTGETMNAVIVSAVKKDRAEEIVRNVIRGKEKEENS